MGVSVATARLLERLFQYGLLMRFNKPVGIFLLLWPVLWALWLAAEGIPDLTILLVFVCGVVLMRSAGCVINDYADRKIDPHVARTKHRPLASGRVSSREALLLFAGLCLLAFILVLLLDWLTVMMSLVAVALAALYPFMKRYTHLPQVFLGAAFGWAVPMAFVAQTGELPRAVWLLFLATVLWTTAYDTMYAMVDRKDDLKIGVKSTAILFGDADRLLIGVIQALMFICLVIVGRQFGLGLLYYAGLMIAVALAVYQQYLIRDREAGACFKAFLNNNSLGAVIFAGIALEYLLRS